MSLLKKVSARGFYDYGVKTDRGYLRRGGERESSCDSGREVNMPSLGPKEHLCDCALPECP